MTYSNNEILNKSCQVSFNGILYFCYNVTSLMHFVKCGAKGQMLNPNKSNCLNFPKEQVLRLINLGAAKIEVGQIA